MTTDYWVLLAAVSVGCGLGGFFGFVLSKHLLRFLGYRNTIKDKELLFISARAALLYWTIIVVAMVLHILLKGG